nr:PRA1 family protein F3-like [Quercus suber]POE64513.1 pra1 family protein f2 [Quercus suber]
MASYGTMQRPGTSSTSPPSTQPDDSKDSAHKKRNDFKLLCPFNTPISPEAAAVRIIRNLRYFGLYYTLFVWIILFISLVPRRKVSLILLVVMTIVTSLYLTLLRALPNSVVLHRIIDKRLVLSLLAIGTAVELILTRAAIHLVVSLACGIPIVLVHAVLRVSDDLFVGEEACAAGELVPLVHGKTGDVDIESPASV